ncbi:hypothetical protein [Paenibacillus alvei]|uniref:hypothetical protein n=1 Tax=Paenibacillus alvei TaxID=44250 RepID=UPI0018CE8FD1|nr:hypothetical protein [Paenibacillus alvei]MBG9735516.1 hypothetical protein [Paenibacillus alvei]MBG9746753.1 hypothetical protein [Paenibacillus alvei]MCY9578539.1 hypothetical protein [Paenibacillus alvei]MCY9584860.1 hypothetical protein [Paenibacillus alvei]
MSFVWENALWASLFLLIPVAVIIVAVVLIIRSRKRAHQLHARIAQLEHQMDNMQRNHEDKHRH